MQFIVHIVYPFLHGYGLHCNVLAGLSVKGSKGVEGMYKKQDWDHKAYLMH